NVEGRAGAAVVAQYGVRAAVAIDGAAELAAGRVEVVVRRAEDQAERHGEAAAVFADDGIDIGPRRLVVANHAVGVRAGDQQIAAARGQSVLQAFKGQAPGSPVPSAGRRPAESSCLTFHVHSKAILWGHRLVSR